MGVKRKCLFVLPFSEAEMVLGIQWLKTLGSILTNYESLTMTFKVAGKQIQLM